MDALDLDLDAASDIASEPVVEVADDLLDGDNLQPESEEDVFAEALHDLESQPEVADDFSAEGLEADLSAADEMDDELDFLADTDEVATKLDLARAYIDMGDSEGAKDILAEVQQEGDETQKSEAEELLGRMD
jgi:pilus assembly protein FimV